MDKIKILYIEDEAKQRKPFEKQLGSQGFVVTSVASGEAGLNSYKKKKADVVLCDLNMPKMSGLQFLRKIKRIDPVLPVIILTAHGSVDLAVKALKQGAYDFVLKPLEINEIITTIHKAIEKKKLLHMLEESESNLEILMENVPDLIYSLNTKGQFLNVSPAAKGLLGYNTSELVGRSVFDLIHPEDKDTVKARFKKAMTEGDSAIRTVEFRMVSKKGETRHFEVNRRLILKNGKVIRQDGIARDVTQRKLLEQELKKYSHELEKRVEERTERLEYANRQLIALNNVSNRFSLIYSEEELLKEAPKLLCKTLDFDRTVVMTEEAGRLDVFSLCMAKDTPKLVKSFLRRVKSKKLKLPPHFMESFNQNKTIFIPDLNADARWPIDEPGQIIRTKAIVISPIRVGKKAVGVIIGNMQHHEREMDDQDIARFEMFANMVGFALDNIRAYQTLENKVIERTKKLRHANVELRKKANETEKQTYSLAKANVDLLAFQEQLEKKNAEMGNVLKDLSESEEKFRQLTENIHEAFWIVDLNLNKTIYVSPAYEAIFGRPAKKLYENPFDWINMVHPDDRNPLSSELEKHTSEENEQEFRIVLPDQSIRWIRSRAFPIQNSQGEIYRICGVSRDITERKQAREALEMERNFVSTILDTAGALVVVLDTKGRIVRFNRACEQTTGYSFDEVKSKYIWDRFLIPTEVIRVRATFDKLIAGNFPNQTENYWLTKSGEQRLIAWSNTALVDKAGNIEFVIGTGIDITQRKQAEEALKETQIQLVQSEKMAALGMLVAGIAHEINTPIGAVSSMHDTLKRAVAKLKEALESQFPNQLQENRGLSGPLKVIEEANRIIDSGSDRVTTIVRRLRSFARLDEAELKTVDIHEGIEDTLTLIHHEIKHTIKVIKNFGDIPPIACFPGRLNQVYLNLLINSKQAIQEKGEITITTGQEDGKVQIKIADNGIGIPKEKLKNVFDPGYTTKGVGVGTGLGLSIVYQIIEDHKGTIKVDSEMGEGTTFTITLPMNLDKLLGKV